jgi:hypothetical protein
MSETKRAIYELYVLPACLASALVLFRGPPPQGDR